MSRLGLQRADLQYQKIYLGLQVADLLASQKVTLSYIKGMGLKTDASLSLSPRRKFIRCVNSVIAVFRLRILSRNWRNVVESTGQDVGQGQILVKSYSGERLNHDASNRLIAVLEQKIATLRLEKQQMQEQLAALLSEKRIADSENQQLVSSLRVEVEEKSLLMKKLNEWYVTCLHQ